MPLLDLPVCGDLYRSFSQADSSILYRSLSVMLDTTISKKYKVCNKDMIFVNRKDQIENSKIYASNEHIQITRKVHDYKHQTLSTFLFKKSSLAHKIVPNSTQ